ncbi:hypothetical protein WJX72_001339 [[Myrmecia] bisecta]|uniref:Uncharacterized protein n=1 Tax=[Myrmecia] bisecta TaxID=41462 RepID=A0AAW1QPS5_9CHLO
MHTGGEHAQFLGLLALAIGGTIGGAWWAGSKYGATEKVFQAEVKRLEGLIAQSKAEAIAEIGEKFLTYGFGNLDGCMPACTVSLLA